MVFRPLRMLLTVARLVFRRAFEDHKELAADMPNFCLCRKTNALPFFVAATVVREQSPGLASVCERSPALFAIL